MTRLCDLLFVLLFFSVVESKKFRWKHCNGRASSDAITITSLNISPHPIRLPGTIKIEFNTQLHSNLTGPLSIKADIWKVKRRRFITSRTKIPIGLCCKFDDLCAEVPTADSCPAYLTSNHIDCNCPPTPGMFNTSVTPVTFTVEEIPFFAVIFASGSFEAQVKLFDGHSPDKRLLACLEVDVRVQARRV